MHLWMPGCLLITTCLLWSGCKCAPKISFDDILCGDPCSHDFGDVEIGLQSSARIEVAGECYPDGIEFTVPGDDLANARGGFRVEDPQPVSTGGESVTFVSTTPRIAGRHTGHILLIGRGTGDTAIALSVTALDAR